MSRPTRRQMLYGSAAALTGAALAAPVAFAAPLPPVPPRATGTQRETDTRRTTGTPVAMTCRSPSTRCTRAAT